MPEEEDTDKRIYSTKKPKSTDIYEGIESHFESEKDEGSEEDPTAAMKDRTGPIILSPSTYVEEDEAFDKVKRAPMEEQKKKYPPDKVPKDEFAAFRG